MSHLIILLPTEPSEAGGEVPWWLAYEGIVGLKGNDTGWLERVDGENVITAIAPPGSVRLQLAEELQDPQTRTAARLGMIEEAIGTADTLHAAIGDKLLEDGRTAIALVDRAKMDAWLDWAERLGALPRQIIPAATLLPADGQWHEARLAGMTFVGRDGIAFEDQPALIEALVGDQFVDTLDRAHVEDALVREAMEPTVDLRQGDYAWRKPWRLDLGRLKEFAILLGLIAFTALLIQLVQIGRLDAAEDRLDADTARLATDALGREVTADEAETQLAGRATRVGAGDAIAALVAHLENGGLVSLQNVGWDEGGILSATLVSPDANAANSLLIDLQRDGWSVTANDRPSGDGRQLVDITMRSGR